MYAFCVLSSVVFCLICVSVALNACGLNGFCEGLGRFGCDIDCVFGRVFRKT